MTLLAGADPHFSPRVALRSRFQYTVYDHLSKASGGAEPRKYAELTELSQHLFGDAAYTQPWIRQMVSEGRSLPEERGRPTHFPRHAEAVLFRFVSRLRQSAPSPPELETLAACHACSLTAPFRSSSEATRLQVDGHALRDAVA